MADIYGENKFVIVMGGLHIDMSALRVIGDWLEGSGWINALIKANVTTPGRAHSVLESGHITRTRWAHQVTAAALFMLQMEAYELYKTVEIDEPLPFQDLCTAQSEKSPQFKFWSTALYLLVLQYVKSLRQGKFEL